MSARKSAPEMKAGDIAPDFKLLTDEGKEITLSSFRGKKVVLAYGVWKEMSLYQGALS